TAFTFPPRTGSPILPMLQLLLGLAAGQPPIAPVDSPPPAPPAPQQLRAIRLGGGQSINIDGVLNEALWQSAERVTGFSQPAPNQGAVPTESTVVYIARTPRDGGGFVSRFPDLVGSEQMQPPRRREILPYVTSRAAFTQRPAGNPFNDGSKIEQGFGADAKIGLGSNLTLNATINPDF